LTRWRPDAAIVQHIKAVTIANAEFIVFMFAGVAFNFLHRGFLSAKKAFSIAGAAVFAFICLLTIGGIGSLGWSYGAAVLAFCLAMAWHRWVPDGPVWRFLSDISYPLYVIHVLPGYVLMDLMLSSGANPSLSIAAATIVSFLCAWLLHVFVELPSHNLGKNLARNHSTAPG